MIGRKTRRARKKSYKKKRSFSKRGGYRKRRRMPLSGFPLSKTVKLRYCMSTAIATNAASNAPVGIAFGANNAYDPYIPIGGHQPCGWDTWAGLYNHYVVKGARMKVTFYANTQSTDPGPVQCGIYLNDVGTILGGSTGNDLIEQGKGVHTVIYPLAAGGSRNVATLNYKFSTKKFFGVKDVKDNQDELGALVTAAPTEQAYFLLWAANVAALATAQSINMDICCDYIVQFSEKKQLPQS